MVPMAVPSGEHKGGGGNGNDYVLTTLQERKQQVWGEELKRVTGTGSVSSALARLLDLQRGPRDRLVSSDKHVDTTTPLFLSRFSVGPTAGTTATATAIITTTTTTTKY